ncbi:MAG: glycosyltransferase family 2 protein, partial [Armatimonadota bacterium]
MTPEITVCIVHWNTPDDLRSCIKALLASSTASITETIVVDNASKPDVIHAFQRDFPGNSLLLNKANVVYAAGCNQA